MVSMDYPVAASSRRVFSAPPKRYRPTSTSPISWDAGGIAADANRPNYSLLRELMFKHGRQLDQFPVISSQGHLSAYAQGRTCPSNAWCCDNKAFRQMYCTSAKTPRRRMFNGKVTLFPDDQRSMADVQQPTGMRSERVKRTRSAPPNRPKPTNSFTSETYYDIGLRWK